MKPGPSAPSIISTVPERGEPAPASFHCISLPVNHNATSLAIVVAMWGYDTRTAADGVAALDLVAQFHPDVVLADLAMPRIDGLELARRLSGTKRPVLVAVTGLAGPAYERAAADAGFDLFFPKPADPDELRRLLAQAQSLKCINRRTEDLANQGETMASDCQQLIDQIRREFLRRHQPE